MVGSGLIEEDGRRNEVGRMGDERYGGNSGNYDKGGGKIPCVFLF